MRSLVYNTSTSTVTSRINTGGGSVCVCRKSSAFIYERVPPLIAYLYGRRYNFGLFTAGAEFDAQVPAEDPPGEAAGLEHGEADRGPRKGAAQDLHIPGGHIHRCHRLSESARKFHFVSRYRYTPAFPFCALAHSLFLSSSFLRTAESRTSVRSPPVLRISATRDWFLHFVHRGSLSSPIIVSVESERPRAKTLA